MDHSADDFALHFARKVENIRVFTAGAPPPVIKTRFVPEPLAAFNYVTSDEVKRSLGKAPAKHCILDPVPTWLPISNLSFISKMVERMVDSRLIAYTDRYALTPI